MVNVTQGFISVGGGQSVSGDSAPPPPPDLGAANFRKDIDLGFTQSITLEMRQAQDVGLSAEQAPATLLTNEGLGLSVDTFASGTSKPEQTTGLTMGAVLVMNNLPEKSAGFAIEQFWDYTGDKYVATASNIGSDNFSNPTNAQGAQDGSSATRSGQALASTSAQLRCVHVAVGNKDELNIDKVELRFYAQQSGTTLGNGGMGFDWRIGSSGGWTNLASYTDNQNFLTTPDTFDVTGSITDWNDIRDIETRVTATLALGTVAVTISVDAVDKHIEASLIE